MGWGGWGVVVGGGGGGVRGWGVGWGGVGEGGWGGRGGVSLHDARPVSGAVKAIAQEAYGREAGARALRGIVGELMLDVMYELPSRKDVTRCPLPQDLVAPRSPAELLVHPSSFPNPASA